MTNEFAFTLLSAPPLPVKEPVKFTPVWVFVTTVPGNCASESVPVMFAAATELALAATVAVAALAE